MRIKILRIICLFLLFAGFLAFNFLKQRKEAHKILEVKSADMFCVDLNDNSRCEDEEIIKLKDVYVLSPDLNDFTKMTAKKHGIKDEEYLKAGFIAQNWAFDNLKGKIVEISNIEKYKNYKYANIFYSGENLAEFYLKNGLAFASKNSFNGNYFALENPYQIKKNAKEISKLHFVLVNLKNNVFHETSCQWAKYIKRARLILKNKSKDFTPCKVCQTKPTAIVKTNVKEIVEKEGSIELYFINPLVYERPNTQCVSVISKKLVKEIDEAKESIDVALYGFGNISCVMEALKRAKARGVTIRVVADNSKNSEEIYPNTEELIKLFPSKTDTLKTLMHNKFFIFDNKKVLTGSSNISSSGIGGYNANIAVLINSKDIAKMYEKEFSQMFEGKFSKSKEIVSKSPLKIENSVIEVYFSPKDDIRSVILEKLQKAKSEVCVSAFYLTDNNILEELMNLKAKGIKVFVILDAVGANNFKNKVKTLREKKIPVIVENWGGKNHEKTIMVDSKILIFGSCNFTKSGFEKNDENVVVIENANLAKAYRKYFFELFNSIDKKFLNKIPRSEGFDSINSCSDGLDNNFDGKKDKEDVGCQ
ncbi:DUF1669 domain-containing protein [bacterium]|nr:DUF1669 domain-containing protein [bacterium]